MDKISIVKIGGNIINDPQELESTLEAFSKLSGPKILVHGGGRLASDMSKRLGITPKMIDGRRITDLDTLEVVTMVYAGLINKQIVAQLQSLGTNAIGLSGADGNVIKATKRPKGKIDYGYAGNISSVSADALSQLLSAGFTPVCCPITHDQQGQLLNTNADTIASSVATALSSTFEAVLYYLFDKSGVLLDVNDENSLIPLITPEKYEELKRTQSVHTGMIPKLDNCMDAIGQGVHRVYIGQPKIIADNSTPKTTISL